MAKTAKYLEDRRDSIRAKRIVTIRHRLVKHRGKRATTFWQLSTTENMSLSGTLFISAIAYHLDDIIELQVVMSGVIDIFNGYGKVMRVTKNKGGYFFIACKYVDLKPAKNRAAKSLLTPKKK